MPFQIPAGVMNSAFVLAALSLFGLLIRQIGPWRKQTDDVSARLREALTDRVAKLETRLDSQGKRHDAHIEILRQLHEGEIALLRHRVNGEEQNNIALMTVLQTLDVPQRTMDALEAARARKQEGIAAEQAQLTKLRATAIERLARLMDGDISQEAA